jgi:hypothetical protein
LITKKTGDKVYFDSAIPLINEDLIKKAHSSFGYAQSQ